MINNPVFLLSGLGLLCVATCSATEPLIRVLPVNKYHHPTTEINCFFWQTAQEQHHKSCFDFHFTAEMEAFNLRNKKLRQGKKRENELELEPLLRLNARIMRGSPVEGRIEMEWKRVMKRESAKPPEKQTRLELNQAYLKLNKQIIPDTEWKLGRWLYRDEREWLIDENLDGVLVKWKDGDWSADAFGGRVNYWQKDLLDRSSRKTESINIMGLLLRDKLAKSWAFGAYGFTQQNVSNESFRQTNYGLRSWDNQDRQLRHWLEMGMAEGHKKRARIRGYVLDAGGTWIFQESKLKPRITLGYTVASKNYHQTGLHANEAKFGGDTKFQIYGETLNPELSNIQIFTFGLGTKVGERSTLDLVYHDYSQTRLTEITDDTLELSPRYDRQNSRRLGYSLDLIHGWKPLDNLRLETRLGVFTPSSRFASGSTRSSSRSPPAYSAAIEMKIAF